MSSDSDPPEYAPITARDLKRTFPEYEDQLKHSEIVPTRDGAYVDPHEVLRPELANPFSETVGDLYTHQVAALRHLADGDNVCVATSTSSGKTYIYALQIARNHLAAPDSMALLVYPTKALSRDQEQNSTSSSAISGSTSPSACTTATRRRIAASTSARPPTSSSRTSSG